MHKLNRILGIDFGHERVGLSISDPLGIIATPYRTLKNNATIWREFKEIIAKETIGLLVIGMPVTLRGTKSTKANEVDSFVEQLKLETGLDVIALDERYSTAIAQKTLIQMNTKKKQRNAKNGTLDSMAAAIILQDFLDSRKRSLVC